MQRLFNEGYSYARDLLEQIPEFLLATTSSSSASTLAYILITALAGSVSSWALYNWFQSNMSQSQRYTPRVVHTQHTTTPSTPIVIDDTEAMAIVNNSDHYTMFYTIVLPEDKTIPHNEDCSICIESRYEDLSNVANLNTVPIVCKLNGCNHVFHEKCISDWWDTRQTKNQPLSCPLCDRKPSAHANK